MNNQEFLKESIDFVQNVYSHFEIYQRISWEILNELNRICKKKCINFWLCYGTLLGAIRDHGPIPWDYDVDVVSFFDERQKLIDALENDLSDDFYYTYITNSPYYSGGYRLLRVCKKGYSKAAIHVDIFFLVGASENIKKMILYHRIMARIKHIYEIKCLPRLYKVEVEPSQRFRYAIYKCLYSFIPLRLLNLVELHYLNKYSTQSNVYIPFYGKVVPKDCFELDYVTVNGVEYPIPRGYHIILQKIYGDYNKYPAVDMRIQEFYTHARMIDFVQSNYQE